MYVDIYLYFVGEYFAVIIRGFGVHSCKATYRVGNTLINMAEACQIKANLGYYDVYSSKTRQSLSSSKGVHSCKATYRVGNTLINMAEACQIKANLGYYDVYSSKTRQSLSSSKVASWVFPSPSF